MTNILSFLLLGLVAGLISGMFGIGGAIIIVPGLVYLLGFTQQTAQGTSLAMLLPPIGILAVINYYKAGFVDIKAAGFMIITFLIGSYVSSKISISLDHQTLRKAFAVVLMGISIFIYFKD